MLQINIQPYASDALEDAMRLAQTKALNSYSFSDCLNYLNYTWSDVYQRMAQMDEGYYSRTVRITQKLTKLPPYVKNTIKIYSAQQPVGFNRQVFRSSGSNDLQSRETYHISGFDLYVPEALSRTVWLNYIPMAPMIFFTHHNRDPKTHPTFEKVESTNYNMYDLVRRSVDVGSIAEMHYILAYKGDQDLVTRPYDVDIQSTLYNKDWLIKYISCDYPYIFVSYENEYTGEYLSGFFKDMHTGVDWTEYNPFAYTGRNSNVEYLKTSWNDKTGMGVVVKDHNDGGAIKELGWTPDTLLTYPAPEAYRLLVARLADKFSALNESNVMGVQKELAEAQYAFDNFLKKDKSSWSRIDNVNGPTMADWL
jgi:hypothetical protein